MSNGSRHWLILHFLLVLDRENGMTERDRRVQRKTIEKDMTDAVCGTINDENVSQILNVTGISRAI